MTFFQNIQAFEVAEKTKNVTNTIVEGICHTHPKAFVTGLSAKTVFSDIDIVERKIVLMTLSRRLKNACPAKIGDFEKTDHLLSGKEIRNQNRRMRPRDKSAEPS
ncbi:MAG: hypothetical protein IJL30_02980 [Clostridia bacterium]|nr:hypothetical protein [Clostridia bacterium]